MFYLETEFFAWNFLAWAANSLLGTIVIIIAVIRQRQAGNFTFIESNESAYEPREHFITGFERCLWLLRSQIVDVWLGSTWLLIAAPLFLIALFMVAVSAR